LCICDYSTCKVSYHSRYSSSYLFTCYFYIYPLTTSTYTLSLHDALPISNGSYWPFPARSAYRHCSARNCSGSSRLASRRACATEIGKHTSELQSRFDLVCRLLLEKKKKMQLMIHNTIYITIGIVISDLIN